MENPIILDVTPTYGMVLLGLLFSFSLYGIACLQVFIYSMNWERDSVGMRCFILVLWVFETANQVCLVWGSWNTFVRKYGSIQNLGALQIGIMHHIWTGHIVIFSTQMYLARRIWLFGRSSARSKLPYITVYLLLILILALGMVICVIVYEAIGYNGADLAALSVPVEIGLNMAIRICAAAVDILIAIGMVVLLKATSPRFSTSKKLVHRMLIVTVSSGSLTAFFATLVMILVAVRPDELWFCFFDFPLGSLYLNTLLANINSRDFIREGLPGSRDNNIVESSNFNTFSSIGVSTHRQPALHVVERAAMSGAQNESLGRVESDETHEGKDEESMVRAERHTVLTVVDSPTSQETDITLEPYKNPDVETPKMEEV